MKKIKFAVCMLLIVLISIPLMGCAELLEAFSMSSVKASDYSTLDNWLRVPENSDKPVDVFYLYPTSWLRLDENYSASGLFPRGVYHGQEHPLYYYDIMENVDLRSKNFIENMAG